MTKTTRSRRDQPVTTAQRLSSLVKSCRDIMRKDKGLNGDLDRLPMLTWILFLKFLDDLELQHEAEAVLAGRRYRSAVEAPYRWRDWAGREDGITGDELMAFINNEEAGRPDGTKGPGLFAHLRALQGADGGDRRDVIRTVFQGVVNRMVSGYLLRDVLNKVNEIHFTASDEIHTLSHLYETMLREMRDAAGDSGEFYTPRPVVRLIVEMMDPRLGETVLDPACGTGGFLVEAFEHLRKQCQKAEDMAVLQRRTLYGVEAKSLPYLLCQMNLTLHGLESPSIDAGNALRHPLNEIGDKDRVDVIMTNPPFGGEEERGILGNFPEDKRTAETALLFLQLLMRKLRRPGHEGRAGGRAAVVVPDGVLFGDTAPAVAIKRELLSDFNLHTVVRLPNGVFAPYAAIRTNILLFDRTGPTSEIWFYEHQVPLGQKNYTKTKPLRDEDFSSLRQWWGGTSRSERQETPQAWRVPLEKVIEGGGYNLDLRNPNEGSAYERMSPGPLVVQILDRTKEATTLLQSLSPVLLKMDQPTGVPEVPLGQCLTPRKEFITIDDVQAYKRCRVQLYGQGVVLRDTVQGAEIKTKEQQVCRAGELLVAEIDAKLGGFAIVPDELDGAIVSSHYFLYVINEGRLDRRYLAYFLRTRRFLAQVQARGSTNYAAIRPEHVLGYTIPLPDPRVQVRWVELLTTLAQAREKYEAALADTEGLIESVLSRVFTATNGGIHGADERQILNPAGTAV